jgi:hypothetical protein
MANQAPNTLPPPGCDRNKNARAIEDTSAKNPKSALQGGLQGGAARAPKGGLQGGLQGGLAGTASSNTPQVSNQTKLQQLKPMPPQPPKNPR